MIRQKNHLRKSKHRFIPQTIFPFESNAIVDNGNPCKIFLIYLVKFRAEGRIPLTTYGIY